MEELGIWTEKTQQQIKTFWDTIIVLLSFLTLLSHGAANLRGVYSHARSSLNEMLKSTY